MNFTQMLNEEEEDKEDEEDYKRNLIVKLDHLLEQPQEICKKNPNDKRSDMPYKE